MKITETFQHEVNEMDEYVEQLEAIVKRLAGTRGEHGCKYDLDTCYMCQIIAEARALFDGEPGA